MTRSAPSRPGIRHLKCLLSSRPSKSSAGGSIPLVACRCAKGQAYTVAGTYNADGEQLTATQNSSAVSQAAWNGAGQLMTHRDSAANMTAATYDGLGLRAATTLTPAGKSAVTEGYVCDIVPQVPAMIMDSVNAHIYDIGPVPTEHVNLTTGCWGTVPWRS
jgi:YD repeat-containing protein